MRKVIFGVANTLDNYLARKDGSVDWILWGEEASAVIAEYRTKFDTVVMGRKTYEVMLRLGDQGGNCPDVKRYVFSRTLSADSHPNITIILQDPGKFVRDLRQQAGKDICVLGGGELAKTLFDADVIDEIGFTIHPVLLGSGIPLFHPMNRQIDLELLECRPFKNGCVLVIYRVKH